MSLTNSFSISQLMSIVLCLVMLVVPYSADTPEKEAFTESFRTQLTAMDSDQAITFSLSPEADIRIPFSST